MVFTARHHHDITDSNQGWYGFWSYTLALTSLIWMNQSITSYVLILHPREYTFPLELLHNVWNLPLENNLTDVSIVNPLFQPGLPPKSVPKPNNVPLTGGGVLGVTPWDLTHVSSIPSGTGLTNIRPNTFSTSGTHVLSVCCQVTEAGERGRCIGGKSDEEENKKQTRLHLHVRYKCIIQSNRPIGE
jgi:hypothetical protein